MEDISIIELYFARSEKAIAETADKYGAFCLRLANGILSNHEDAEECVNDTWLAAWNSIPPARPLPLKPYVGRITRNLAFNQYAYRTAEKRNANATVLMDEMGEVADGTNDPDFDTGAITACINEFLAGLDRLNRAVFLRRYWYYDSIAAIAKTSGLQENIIKARLARMRGRLKKKLLERGIGI